MTKDNDINISQLDIEVNLFDSATIIEKNMFILLLLEMSINKDNDKSTCNQLLRAINTMNL